MQVCVRSRPSSSYPQTCSFVRWEDQVPGRVHGQGAWDKPGILLSKSERMSFPHQWNVKQPHPLHPCTLLFCLSLESDGGMKEAAELDDLFQTTYPPFKGQNLEKLGGWSQASWLLHEDACSAAFH